MKGMMILLLTLFISIESHPLFFDSIFPSFRPTTPESVVSDYRERKLMNSSAEHVTGHNNSNSEKTKVELENIEFYAEAIGKLVGSIRDGVSYFFGEIKQRRLPQSDIKSAKLKSNLSKNSTVDTSMIPKNQNSTVDSDTGNIHRKINETSFVESNSKKIEEEISSSVQFSTELPTSMNNVVQVITRKTKYKRSDDSYKNLDDMDLLGIPVDSAETMTNEEMPCNINFINQLTKLQLFNNLTSREINSSLAFRGEILANIPLQDFFRLFPRLFHRGTDEHDKIRQKTKKTLQKTFYKFARLYLFARKGYKDARSFNRRVQEEQHKDNDEALQSELNQNDNLNLIEHYTENFAANSSARQNFETLEIFVIFLLEIVGTIIGLTFGAIAQIQASYLFET